MRSFDDHAMGWAGRAERIARTPPQHRGLLERVLRRRSRGPTAGEYRLHRRRIYVLPTRAGVFYAGCLILMLVTSINYALSLGYALTFLLASIGLIALLQTWRNLAAITLRPGKSDPVHRGDMAELQLVVRNDTAADRYALQLHAPGMARAQLVDLAGGVEQIVTVALPTQRRGWQDAPRMWIATTWPLGLWRAWSHWHPALRTMVYPHAETPAVPLPATSGDGGELPGQQGHGNDDFAAIRPYVPGDSPRQLAWRAIARQAGDALLTKQFDGNVCGDLWLDWQRLPVAFDAEARLERLARWVTMAELGGSRYGLLLPGERVPLERGPAHAARCLETLALFGSARQGSA